MFYCETCETTFGAQCTCDRVDGLNDGDVAEAGPIRYRVHNTNRETVVRYRELEALPVEGEDRATYLRMWAVSTAIGKMFSFGGGKDEHLKDAIKVCETADILATYVESGSAEATKTMLALGEQAG